MAAATPTTRCALVPGGCECILCKPPTCTQCGKAMPTEWILGPVCGACCKANHKQATGG